MIFNYMFYFEEINGYKVLKSDLLTKDGVIHCFTTRGITPTLAYPLGENISYISPQQTHSDNIELVDTRLEYPDTDALIITKKNIPIALRFADCTPLIFFDKKQRIGAIAHAGWRGTAQKIAVKTIKKMKVNLGTNPKDVIAIIGPAIGICCYEVSSEVKKTLLDTVIDSQNLSISRNIDLKQINARQLQEIGVTQIDICPYCTSCNNDLFYSYRKENGTQERHYALLML